MTTIQTTSRPMHHDGPGGNTPPALWLLVTTLILSSVAVASALLIRIGEESLNDRPWADVVSGRSEAWRATYIDCIGMALLGVSLSVAVCLVVRVRGRYAAMIGATVTSVAGVLFAIGGTSYATLAWYASSDPVVDGQGEELWTYATDTDFSRFEPFFLVGYLGFVLGTIILAVAVARSRVLPGWLPVGFLVLTFVGHALSEVAVVGPVLESSSIIALGAFALVLLRRR